MKKLVIIVSQDTPDGPINVERYNQGFNRLNHIEALTDALKETAADYLNGKSIGVVNVTKNYVDEQLNQAITDIEHAEAIESDKGDQ